MDNKEFEAKLKELIDQMSNRQMEQFLTITVARSMVYFSDDFFQNKNMLRYMNALFLSLGCYCVLLFNARDLDFDFDFDLDIARFIDLSRARAHDLDLARAYDLYTALLRARDHTLYRARVHAPDLDYDHGLTHALDLARVHAPDRVRAHLDRARKVARGIACDIARNDQIQENMLSDAQKLLSDHLSDMHIIPEGERKYLERFLSNLNKAEAKYWADWYMELCKHNFQLSESRIEELLSIDRSQVDLTIAETSTFLLSRREGTRLFNEARLILLGDKGSGKTTFARRFQDLNAKMPKPEESTPGVDFHKVNASSVNEKYTGEQDYTIHIWDFAGHAVTHAAHKFFLSDRATYVIVLHGRSENTEGTTLDEWFEQITYYTGGSSKEKIKVYILVNQTDRNIPRVEYDLKYADTFDIEKNYVINLRKDNKPGGSLDRLRSKIVNHIVTSQQGRDMPASIFDIKTEIQKEFEGNSNVPKQKIVEIIQKHTSFPPDDILHILHSFGICFYYDKLKSEDDTVLQADMVVLNPRWVTFAIYRLINLIQNDMEKSSGRIDGRIDMSEFDDAFSNEKLGSHEGYTKEFTEMLSVPSHRYPFLCVLAHTFGLAYMKNTYLIFPHCLPKHYPNGKRGLGDTKSDDFFVEITTSTERSTTSPVTFPKNIIPAFIVKRHTNLVDSDTYCSRNGIVLKHPKNKTKAEVKKISDYQIVVLVKGNKQNSCEFGADLVGDLYEVIQRYDVFKKEQTQPKIKISFVDKDREEQSCEIRGLLKDNSWVEGLVEPSKMSGLKQIAQGIAKRVSWGFSVDINTKIINVKAQANLGTEKPESKQ